MRIILLIQLIVCFQFCFCKCEDIQNKWTGYGGTLIIDLQPNHKLNILSINDSSTVLEWKLLGKHLILTDTIKSISDTLIVLHLSKDSLILDMAIPRGYVIKTFYPYMSPKNKYRKEEITAFLSDRKFQIKNIENNDIQIAVFNKNGEYIIDRQIHKWEVKSFEGYVFLVVTGRLGQNSFSKIVNFSERELELEVYYPNKDDSYQLIMELIE